MTENPDPSDPDRNEQEPSEDARARDSLAGDIAKFVDPDIADLDEDAAPDIDEPNPERR